MIAQYFHRALRSNEDNVPCSQKQAQVVARAFSAVARDRNTRLLLESEVFGREIQSTHDLTRGEASTLISFAFLPGWELDTEFQEWLNDVLKQLEW